jgi:hypothetical protein
MSDSSAAAKVLQNAMPEPAGVSPSKGEVRVQPNPEDVDRLAAEIKPSWEGVSKSAPPPASAELEIEPDPIPPPALSTTEMDRAFQMASIAPAPRDAALFDDEDYQLPQKRPLSPVAKNVIFGVLGLAGLVTVGGVVRFLMAPTPDSIASTTKDVAPIVAPETKREEPAPLAKAVEPPPPPAAIAEPPPKAAQPKAEQPAKVEPAAHAEVHPPPRVEPTPKPEVRPSPPAKVEQAKAAPKVAPKDPPKPPAPKPSAKPHRSGIDRDVPF